MKPANDYISDFIKDVNRSRVLEVRSIMVPSKTERGPRLELTMPLEDALSKMSEAGETSGCVVDNKGNIGEVYHNSYSKKIIEQSLSENTKVNKYYWISLPAPSTILLIITIN